MVRPLPEHGSRAPDFVAEGTLGTFSSSEWTTYGLRLLLFYPLAFTPVCSKELVAVDEALGRFRERGAEVLAISVDSLPSIRAFAASLGLSELPLLSDPDQEIVRSFGVLRDEGFAERATFLIDRKGIVRAARVAELMVPREPSALLDLLEEAAPTAGRSSES